MRIQGAVLLIVVGVLAGCAQPSPEPTTPATPGPTPEAETEIAPLGESGLPLGCSDLLANADVAELGADFDEDLSLAIDEDRIIVDMAAVSELQGGTLRCIWAARYGSTDFHASVDVRIAPSTATALDPAAEDQGWNGPLAPLEGHPNALAGCSESFSADESAALFNACEVVQLRDGYRIDLATSGLSAAPGRDTSVVATLLSKIGSAIDAAGPQRAVADAGGTTDPASLCSAAEVSPLLTALGAAGEPGIEAFGAVTRCSWNTLDEYGNAIGPRVAVLPGGAWALPRLRTGVSSIFLQTHPSSDGSFLVGVGDGVSAWRTVGDDLVEVVSGDFEAVDGWEAFVEETW